MCNPSTLRLIFAILKELESLEQINGPMDEGSDERRDDWTLAPMAAKSKKAILPVNGRYKYTTVLRFNFIMKIPIFKNIVFILKQRSLFVAFYYTALPGIGSCHTNCGQLAVNADTHWGRCDTPRESLPHVNKQNIWTILLKLWFACIT